MPSNIALALSHILVASWMDARDLHIAKYITYYQALYPMSKILLVEFVFKESVFPSLAREAIEPAYVYLRSQLESGVLSASPSKPEILAVCIETWCSQPSRFDPLGSTCV